MSNLVIVDLFMLDNSSYMYGVKALTMKTMPSILAAVRIPIKPKEFVSFLLFVKASMSSICNL